MQISDVLTLISTVKNISVLKDIHEPYDTNEYLEIFQKNTINKKLIELESPILEYIRYRKMDTYINRIFFRNKLKKCIKSYDICLEKIKKYNVLLKLSGVDEYYQIKYPNNMEKYK